MEEKTCKKCGKKPCHCSDKTGEVFMEKKDKKRPLKEKKKEIAKKMSGKQSLKSHGRNEGEKMMGDNTTEWNRS